MPDAHYDNPRLAALYDLDSGWSADRDFYLNLPAAPRETILDLGCGTGLICDAYASRGHEVTGVDPSHSMLEIARRKPHGAKIDWVEATAQGYRSDKRFDLIIMTGHAFQVLEENADIHGALTVIRTHLKPSGRAVFESRNPAIDWVDRWHRAETRYNYRGLLGLTASFLQRTVVLGWDRDRLTFEQHFAFPDTALVSTSTLRFATLAEISALISAAGLVLDAVLGDWTGGPFDPMASDEMIFSVRLPA